MRAGLCHICLMEPMRRSRKSFRLECAGGLWSSSCKLSLLWAKSLHCGQILPALTWVIQSTACFFVFAARFPYSLAYVVLHIETQ